MWNVKKWFCNNNNKNDTKTDKGNYKKISINNAENEIIKEEMLKVPLRGKTL